LEKSLEIEKILAELHIQVGRYQCGLSITPIPRQIVITEFPVRLCSNAISIILLATRRIDEKACLLAAILS
jgi:hypothetical protein